MTERERLVGEMARAIWSDQRSRIAPDALSRKHGWLAQSVPDRYWRGFYTDAQAALSAVLKRHRVVPVEPTREMIETALGAWMGGPETPPDAEVVIYRAMLAAAPIQPTERE